MIEYPMTEHQNVLSLCDDLLKLQLDNSPEKGDQEQNDEKIAALCEKLLEGIKSIGLTVHDAAAELGFSDETLYRWKKLGKGPKPIFVRQLREIINARVIERLSKVDKVVRIGVPPFWDAALIRAWETALRSHGLVPKFVSVSHMIHEFHNAFRDGEIDLAIHNDFLIKHDQSLKKEGRSLDLRLQYPLYEFSGYFVYTRRDHVQKKLQGAIAAGKTDVQDAYEKLKSGRWDEVSTGTKKEVLYELLKSAYVGVERGTGMERACRTAYNKSSLHLDEDASVNLRNDQLYDCPINDIGNDPDLADTSQAFDAFVDGSVDIFCGGLAHHYYLSQQNEGSNTEKQGGRNINRRATDKENYILLFGPSDLGVSVINGIVTRQNQHKDIAAIIGDVWHAGVEQFQGWYTDAAGKNEVARSLAVIQLSAMMRVVESQTMIGTYTPHGARITPSDITQTAKWPLWIDSWQTEHVRPTTTDEKREDLILFARKTIDLYRQDWRSRVWQWATLITTHCAFFKTLAEGQAAYAYSSEAKSTDYLRNEASYPVENGIIKNELAVDPRHHQERASSRSQV